VLHCAKISIGFTRRKICLVSQDISDVFFSGRLWSPRASVLKTKDLGSYSPDDGVSISIQRKSSGNPSGVRLHNVLLHEHGMSHAGQPHRFSENIGSGFVSPYDGGLIGIQRKSPGNLSGARLHHISVHESKFWQKYYAAKVFEKPVRGDLCGSNAVAHPVSPGTVARRGPGVGRK
jgi:hypothetical protein